MTPTPQGSDLCPDNATCAYCEHGLSARHEHDHAPIPQEAGGKKAYCVCLNCHDLKDRVPLNKWPLNVYVNALRGFIETPWETKLFMFKWMRMAAVDPAGAEALFGSEPR